MKCPNPNCGVENREGASFCRACGAKLAPQATNIMDKFPDYNFVPTNLIDWKKPRLGWIITIFLYLALCVTSFLFIYSIVTFFAPQTTDVWVTDYGVSASYESNADFLKLYDCYSYSNSSREIALDFVLSEFKEINLIGIIVYLILSLLFFFFSKLSKRSLPAKENLLKNSADYIQKYQYTGLIRGKKKPILKFFVKDNKMGLMDVAHYCVFLPAQFDVLEWREKNKYLNATIGNRTFIIDINGKELK